MDTKKSPTPGEPLAIPALRLLTYVGQAAIFFWLMSAQSFAILTFSRTMAVCVLTYAVMVFAMHSVYGGFEVGRKKSHPIITSMWLGQVCTDLVTYLMLQIMNVNSANNEYLQLFGIDCLYLLAAMGLQLVLLCVTVRTGNEVYFAAHPPRQCLLILGDMRERDGIERKIGQFRLQWQVTDVALWTDRYLPQRIEQA